MKIAIPTNDRKTSAERSGRAAEFAIFDVNENGVNSVDYLVNEHELTHHSGHNHDHNEEHGHSDLVELLHGIDVIIGKKFGPHFAKDFHQAGIKMKLSKLDNLEEIALSTFQGVK